jgi:hypothetical protein
MGRRFALILTLTAWLFATGSHWDLVQTFGWGRMIASYSKTMPLAEAIRLTFTTDNVCSICVLVQDAKQAGNDATVPGGRLETKVLLVFQPVPSVVVSAPDCSSWHLAENSVSSLGRSSPPTPPPRGA